MDTCYKEGDQPRQAALVAVRQTVHDRHVARHDGNGDGDKPGNIHNPPWQAASNNVMQKMYYLRGYTRNSPSRANAGISLCQWVFTDGDHQFREFMLSIVTLFIVKIPVRYLSESLVMFDAAFVTFSSA